MRKCKEMALVGYLHSFESMAAVDGEGLRCAVFLAGCPLRCVYCHNPDTWQTDRATKIDPETLVKKIRRIKPYFGSNGGVTFTGGEPLLQAAFLCEVIPYLREEGIRYTVDTSGGVSLTEDVKKVLLGAQAVLLDLKFWDDESYRKYTGVSMENVLNLFRFLEEHQVRTFLKTVVVPEINDSEEILARYLPHAKGKTRLCSWELLPFHTMGFFKYEEGKIPNPLLGTPSLSTEKLHFLQRFVDENR